jgi:hypothetical protein
MCFTYVHKYIPVIFVVLDSIPAIAIGRRLELLDAKTNLRTRLGGPVGLILIVKTKKKEIYPVIFVCLEV